MDIPPSPTGDTEWRSEVTGIHLFPRFYLYGNRITTFCRAWSTPPLSFLDLSMQHSAAFDACAFLLEEQANGIASEENAEVEKTVSTHARTHARRAERNFHFILSAR